MKFSGIAGLVLLTACGTSSPAGFDGFEQMEGLWTSRQTDGKIFSEQWKIKGDRMYGQGYLVTGSDTLFGEKLVVERVNGRLVYIADVQGQDPVLFSRLGKSKSFRFENSEHDFPRVILYEPIDEQNLKVWLQGKQNDSTVSETLLCKRN